MRLLKYFPLILLVSVAFCTVSLAQETDEQPANTVNQNDFRATALRQLGLTRQQLQQIRRLNQERKPRVDAAQMRFRRANRALDEAIYSDTATDAEIEERLKEFQLAQADLAKLRFMGELGVRRVLTPEQLTRFRNLRQRFEQARTNAANKTDARPAGVRPNASGTPDARFVTAPPRKP